MRTSVEAGRQQFEEQVGARDGTDPLNRLGWLVGVCSCSHDFGLPKANVELPLPEAGLRSVYSVSR